MQIPARYAPIVFGAILSAIMVAIVSAFVLVTTQGIQPQFLAQWGRSCLMTWPVAFPTVTIVAPWVRRIVARVTAPAVVATNERAVTPGADRLQKQGGLESRG